MALKVQHKLLYKATSIGALGCFRLDYLTSFHSITLQVWYFSLRHKGLDLLWNMKTWGCISLSYLIARCLNALTQSRAESWFMWLKLPSEAFEEMLAQKSIGMTHHKQAFNNLYDIRKCISIIQRSATSLLDLNTWMHAQNHMCSYWSKAFGISPCLQGKHMKEAQQVFSLECS